MKQNVNFIVRFLVALVLLVCVSLNVNADTLRKGGSVVGKIEPNGDVRIGGSIKGHRIDVAFDTHEEALAFGRRDLEIIIVG